MIVMIYNLVVFVFRFLLKGICGGVLFFCQITSQVIINSLEF